MVTVGKTVSHYRIQEELGAAACLTWRDIMASLRLRLAGNHSSFLSTAKPPTPFITLAVVRENSLTIPRVIRGSVDATNGIPLGLNW